MVVFKSNGMVQLVTTTTRVSKAIQAKFFVLAEDLFHSAFMRPITWRWSSMVGMSLGGIAIGINHYGYATVVHHPFVNQVFFVHFHPPVSRVGNGVHVAVFALAHVFEHHKVAFLKIENGRQRHAVGFVNVHLHRFCIKPQFLATMYNIAERNAQADHVAKLLNGFQRIASAVVCRHYLQAGQTAVVGFELPV